MDEKKTNSVENQGVKKPSAPPMKKTVTPSAKPVAPAPVKAPAEKKAEKKSNKKLLAIIIPAIVVLIAGAVVAAVVLKKADDTGKLPETTTKEMIFYATDEDGIAITDDAGMVVTVKPETTVVAVTNAKIEKVTDAKGEVVTDKNGEEKTTTIYEEVTDAKGEVATTVIYQDVNVTVNSVVTSAVTAVVTNNSGEAVTDKVGNTVTTKVFEKVTDAKGEVVTEKITIPQNPNAQKPGGEVIMGTSSAPITDGQGNTAVDNNGQVYTTIIEITSNPSTVEPAAIDWKTALGGTEADYFSSIDGLTDGSYITANVTNSKNGDFEKFAETKYATPYTVLTKYNSNGKEEWRQAVGSRKGLHVVTDVVATEDGGFYAVGYGKSVGGVSGKGYYDGFVYKYDKKGNEEWHKIFGTSTVDLFNAAALCDDGGIIVVGSVGNNNGDAEGFNKPENESAACIVKYDSAGNVVWKNIVGGNTDSFNDVCISKEGNIFCVGNFASGTLFKNLGKTDGGVVKFSSAGKYIDATAFAGTGNDLFSGITACKDGGVVAVGRSNSTDINSPDSLFTNDMASRGGYDAYIIKLDEGLGISFAKPFRGQYDDDLVDIVEKEDGTFVAVGCSNSSTRDFKGITTRGGDDIVIAAFDIYGNLSWARSFGGTADESAYAVCLGSNGGYVVAGRTLSKNIDMNGIAQYVSGKSVGVIAKFPE